MQNNSNVKKIIYIFILVKKIVNFILIIPKNVLYAKIAFAIFAKEVLILQWGIIPIVV